MQQQEQQHSGFVRADVLAERYGVSRDTIREWARSGILSPLRGSRILLFDLAEADQALRQRGRELATAGR